MSRAVPKDRPTAGGRSRQLRSALAAALVSLIAAAPAAADQVEVTAQAKAIRAEFLLRVPPPTTPAAVCLVDTGVNPNPDTVNVFQRIALPVGFDGTDQSPTLHGTQMAMFMGGQSNNYGMVGIWPSARIVSVQANLPGRDAFTVGTYAEGIRRCDGIAETFGIKVIVVTVASEMAAAGDDAVELSDAVTGARLRGLTVVVAGGNNSLRPVSTPANVAGALSVGAFDSGSGALCTFSATGALLLAPGCRVDGADPRTGAATSSQQGTSVSAAIAGTAIAALRTWRPDLSVHEVDQLVNTTAVPSEYGRRLDLTAAFDAAGLQSVTAVPVSPLPDAAPTAPAVVVQRRLPKPRVKVRASGRGKWQKLVIRSSNRPRGATMTTRAYRRVKHKHRLVSSRTRRSSLVKMRVPRTWRRVTVYFKDPSGSSLQSRSTVVPHR